MIKGRLSSTSADTPVSLPHGLQTGLQTAGPMVGPTLASWGAARRRPPPCKGGALPTEL